MTTWFSTAAVPPALRLRWDLSTNAASTLVVVLQLGFVAGALVSAVVGLADRVDVRRLVAVSAVGAAVTNVLIVPLDGFAAAIVLRFLTGAFLAGVYPPALKFVATWFRAGRAPLAAGIPEVLAAGNAPVPRLQGRRQGAAPGASAVSSALRCVAVRIP